MTRKVLLGSNFWKILSGVICLVVAMCLQPVALAQHGGFAGGGHFGGGHVGGGGLHSSATSASHGARTSTGWHWPWHSAPHNTMAGAPSSVATVPITTPVTLQSNGLLLSPITHPTPVQQPAFFVPIYFGSPFFYGGFNSFGCGAFWGAGCYYSPFSAYGYGFGGYYGGFYGGWGGGYSGVGAGSSGAYAVSNGDDPSTPIAPSLTQSDEPPAHRDDLVELFFKDGTVADVTDYWVVDGQLHFVTVDQSGQKTAEHMVPFDTLDLQTTTDDNTSRGFKFQLRKESLEQYYRQHPEVVPKGVEPEAPAGNNPSSATSE